MSVYVDYFSLPTQEATKTSTPLARLRLFTGARDIESDLSLNLIGSASNNATTATASGTFAGPLLDGTQISGTFANAPTK